MLGSMKKVWKICLCFILLITLLSGCSKDKKSKETTLEQTEVEKAPITFTYWSADTTAGQMDDGYKSPVSQKIKELTGVTLEKEFAIGDPREKLSFMAASGEFMLWSILI